VNDLRHELLTEHFLAAAALDGQERRTYLSDLERREPDLIPEIESLLQHDGSRPWLLEPGTLADLGDCPLRPGDRVGPYHLVEVLGAGGMGIVFRAEQREPIRREVALKLIRGGFPTQSTVARFEVERLVLERMEHPHIARLLDAGTTDEGLRYVVMEYVRGEPITRFCDRERVGLTDRLRLFIQVCAAVHYAHQNAIVHRDIKPSNILVARLEDEIAPKVIDFGIAKLLVDNPSAATLPGSALLVGTPAYMSPEQASAGRRHVDMRSDVYSLGAVLYELLTGQPPLDVGALDASDLEAFPRLLMEQEPLAPSLRFKATGGLTDVVARRRGVGPAALSRRLRGDLDCIALKTLSKEPEQRYDTAADLAADIQRYLKGEPIEARAPSRVYRIGKLVRRHKTASAVIGALLPTLVLFGAAMAGQAHRLAIERDRAEDLSRLMLQLYEAPFSVAWRHGPANASQLLEKNAAAVERRLTGEPILQARLLHAVGVALRATGGTAAAEPILRKAERGLQMTVGSDDPLTLTAAHDLAQCVAENGRLEEAEQQLSSVLEVQRRQPGGDPLEVLRTARDLGVLRKRLERNDEAAPVLEEAHEGFRAHLGIDDPETALTASLLGSVELDLRRLDAAEPLIVEALEHLDPNSPERPIARYNLAGLEALRGDRAAALMDLRDSLAAGFYLTYYADPKLTPLHGDPEFEALAKAAFLRAPASQYALVDAASSSLERGDVLNAEALYRYGMAALAPVGKEGLGLIGNRYALFCLREGRFEEALPYFRADLAAVCGGNAQSERGLLEPLAYVGLTEAGMGSRDQALRAFEEMIQVAERLHGLGKAGWANYARASIEAIEGNRTVALDLLQQAFAAGFSRADLVRDAPMFATLHHEPAFRRIVAQLEDRYEYRFPSPPPVWDGTN